MAVTQQELPVESAATTPEASVRARLRIDFMAWRADALAAGSLVIVALLASLLRFYYDNWLTEPDLFTFFIPWFGYIGDRLGAGELPLWSNNYLGGIPVIGSPSSGWMYILVMALFPLFHVTTAFKLMILGQALIGGIATYVLARRVAMIPIAAFAASAAFVTGPLLYESTRFTLVGSQVSTWIPVAIVSVDLALASRRWLSTLAWAALAGVAMSQMIVAWPGQGVLYGAMWVGAWMLYRTVLMPMRDDPLASRFVIAIVTGTTMTIAAFGTSAAALLPVLDISEQSTIPGGDYSNVLGGTYASVPHQFKVLLYYLFGDNFNVRGEGFGAPVLTLALFGAILAWRRHASAFFAVAFLVGLSLSVANSPTQPILELIPGFEHFHSHRPVAIVWTLSLAPAMLAGSAVQAFIDRRLRPVSQWVILGVMLLLLLIVAQINTMGSWIGWAPLLLMLLVVGIFYLPSLPLPDRAMLRDRRVFQAGLAGLIVTILLFPTGLDAIRTMWSPESPPFEDFEAGATTKHLGKDEYTSDILETSLARTDPGTAAEFLQQQEATSGPFRFTSYSGQGYPTPAYTWVYNTYWWRRMEPNVVGLLVNARTLRLGLEQTSGYNPVQLRAYVEYIDMMNGAKQDYHWSDTFAAALEGPEGQLLDMLNVRYVLVDIAIPEDREDHAAIRERFTEVFRDGHVIVYENPNAFERAWIAHDVLPNQNGLGLALLKTGQVSGATTAYVDGEIPENLHTEPGEEVGALEGDAVTVTDLQQESMRLNVTAADDGLVVISATYADGWTAYVDGRETEVLRTDHAFLGVPVLAGNHIVELRYEPEAVRTGLYIFGLTVAAIAAIWICSVASFLRAPRSEARTEDRAPRYTITTREDRP